MFPNIYIAAFELKSNTKLSHYHLGVFGQSEQNKWSCCKKGSRGADGCETVTQSDNGGSRKRQSSLPPQPDTSVEDIPPITQSLPAHGFLSDETERYILSVYTYWGEHEQVPHRSTQREKFCMYVCMYLCMFVSLKQISLTPIATLYVNGFSGRVQNLSRALPMRNASARLRATDCRKLLGQRSILFRYRKLTFVYIPLGN